ncbi:UxaA family hydrolase [Enterococcus gallinarum]|uniref:Altronate hydrolase n=1 Tax=Enterococcus gallinarum TaxID=1353 RepID=A0A376GVE3_ENTGA|nr:UxaA family hydrolase [Enterococcus gallinarum]MDT2684950.1 UxaA family hydrolase [Enterococcus gallinarum]OJG49887.1 D-galactarate dehydratase [Enterococcus gallinarum]STD81642.1 altronate hydrolase [Enterococcus gallinarum]STE01285.1 altronate hydrolase [Enterococcus gallinarum]
MYTALMMRPEDNVAMVLQPTPAKTAVRIVNQVSLNEVLIAQPIDSYHKFSVKVIESGEKIIKYGEVIGIATAAIAKGEHVHTHNVRSIRV